MNVQPEMIKLEIQIPQRAANQRSESTARRTADEVFFRKLRDEPLLSLSKGVFEVLF